MTYFVFKVTIVPDHFHSRTIYGDLPQNVFKNIPEMPSTWSNVKKVYQRT